VFVFFVGMLSTEYLPMAVFVEDGDKIFDRFNSVNCAAPSKALRSPLSWVGPKVSVKRRAKNLAPHRYFTPIQSNPNQLL